MNFYEFIESLQKQTPDKIVMVKNGAFFNSIGKDAIVLENILGLKRTCYARGLCKCGMPVSYVRENMEKVIKRLKEKNISIVIYDEKKDGRFKYKNKTFDVLFELDGDSIKEERKCLNCLECENNKYEKDTNKYTIEKEIIEDIKKEFKEEILKILNKK